ATHYLSPLSLHDALPISFHTLQYRKPTIGFRGKFSLDYTVATIALDGTIDIDSFTDESANRPALRAMLDKVDLVEHPEWSMDIRDRKSTRLNSSHVKISY